jgi:TetR/AcrR family transcriptional repressor of nem operon
MTREETKQATRDALIAAGMALFAEQGLDAPSLDAICERAGFTRGAFYVHFTDREDFLVAVMDKVGGAYLDAVITAGEGASSLEVTVARFVESVQSGAYPLMPAGGIRPHQLLDACARYPRIRERYLMLCAASIDRVTAVLEAGQAGGSLRRDVPAAAVAHVLVAIVVGAQTMIDLGAPVDIAATAAAALRLIGAPSVLFPSPSPSRRPSRRKRAKRP